MNIMNPAMNKTIYINGRFLTQRITGVQRFAHEIVQQIDRVASTSPHTYIILVPQGSNITTSYQHIAIEERKGIAMSHVWDQVTFPYHARGGNALCLNNNPSFALKRTLGIIHDAAPYRFPENFSFLYRTSHQLIGYLASRRNQLGTVSRFSQHELAQIFRIPPNDIHVIHNGCEHLQSIEGDDSALTDYHLEQDQYFLFVGSPAPNKNLARAIEAFAALKDDTMKFVVVGAKKGNVFGKTTLQSHPRVILCDRLSDEAIVGLYQSAKVLVFPSIYEGFGIPPLEAMMQGCPVLASSIPVIKEVCGDAAQYFDPYNVKDISRAMRMALETDLRTDAFTAQAEAQCALYSWERSAKQVHELVTAL